MTDSAIFRDVRGSVREWELLWRHTTFRIGGPARYFIEPRDEDDVRRVVTACRARKLDIHMLGAGSNILPGDRGVGGAVVHLSMPFFRRVRVVGRTHIEASGGCGLPALLRRAALEGLSGAEFLAGIPGTVGGSLFMNAGAWGKNISQIVEKIRVMDYNGDIKEFAREQVKFGYRTCGLKRWIILGALFSLARGDERAIKAEMKSCRIKRTASQEYSFPNAGCVFKNPQGAPPAGRLIESCGFKGFRVGGAAVSATHANFIINCGNAQAADVLKLMRIIRKKVKDVHNYSLEPEIKIW